MTTNRKLLTTFVLAASGTFVTVSAITQNSSRSGLSLTGMTEFQSGKSQDGDYTLFSFRSGATMVGIRIESDRSRVADSVSAGWSKLLIQARTVNLRLTRPDLLQAEADAAGGLTVPNELVDCMVTAASRDERKNTYALQCVASIEDKRWLRNGKMVYELSVALVTDRGSAVDKLMLPEVNKWVAAWIE
jgi:hypothetical protein